VFAAPFSDHASSAPRKASQRIDQAHVDRGWSEAGSPAQLNALREQMRGQVRPPENLPPRAKSERSKSKDEPAVQDRMPPRNESSAEGRSNREDKPARPGLPAGQTRTKARREGAQAFTGHASPCPNQARRLKAPRPKGDDKPGKKGAAPAWKQRPGEASSHQTGRGDGGPSDSSTRWAPPRTRHETREAPGQAAGPGA